MRTTGIEFHRKGEARFCDIGDPPDPGRNELLLRTRYSGVTNGTERHALMGEHGWIHYPGRHGYQHVCTVEKVGDSVQGFKVGDWVYFGRYVGHRGWHVVDLSDDDPASNNSHLCLRLPESNDYRRYALLGVAGVAMRGIRRVRVQPAHRVWVAGAGLIGQFAAQAARAFGAVVTVSEVNLRRLEMAATLGAHHVVDAGEEEHRRKLAQLGPFDRIVDACGVKNLYLDIAGAGLMAYGGAILSLAVRTETTFFWPMLHGLEGSIEVSCHYSLDDLRIVLHFMRYGQIKVDPLILDVVPIDDAITLYDRLRDEPGRLLGVVFDWS